ncbi:MAG: nucleotidyltransferase family protein, partial [Clostridia bacterium]|nr:nucleotidyltransferase family protein [Clostridia bacterium]
ALFSFFESLGMYYLPLKGIILSEYYPRLGMRQMADNDILIETKYAKKIRAFMKARGYTIYSFGKGCHDVYIKGNLTFELHRKLVEDRREYKEAARFCREAVEKAKREAGKDRRLSLSSEDFYIYLILHFYKHFEYAGVGLRSLMDIYVYRFLSGISFDTQYLEKRFASLGIAQFEQSMRSLASAIFSANPADLSSVIRELSSEQLDLFMFLVSSGTFGTKTGEVRRRLEKAAKGKSVTAFTKAKYLFRRIFPGMAYYRSAHPRLYKWLLPIPFLWAFRLLSAMISPRQFLNELRTLKETKDEK